MITIDYPSQKLLPQVDEAIRFVQDEHALHLRQRSDAKIESDKRYEARSWLGKFWYGIDDHKQLIEGFSQAGEDLRSQKRLDMLYRVKMCCEHAEVVRIDGETLKLITYFCGK